MVRGKFFFTVFSICFVLFQQCNIINPKEGIPAYIHIDSVEVTTNSFLQGANTHAITDAWVLIDSKMSGNYELPVTFPILASGNHTIIIKSGIKVSGYGSQRGVYPFYSNFEMDIFLQEEKVLDLTPVFTYKEEAVFDTWMESFESGHSFDTTQYSNVELKIVNDPYRQPTNHVGLIALDADHTHFEAATIDRFTFKMTNVPVFLEVDFNNTSPFTIGMFMYSGPSNRITQPIITLTESNQAWKKVYLDLSYYINLQEGIYMIELFLAADHNVGAEEDKIYIDNFKLVHFDE